jgi:hypothetical protein
VEQFSGEFDATRSTGHLCSTTVENFEQVRFSSFLTLEEIVDVINFSFLLYIEIEGVAASMLWNDIFKFNNIVVIMMNR